jgi:hypothetical protein
MVIHKPESRKLKEPRIGGIIKKYEVGKWFSFEVEPKPRDLKKSLKELKPRIQTVNNGNYKYFRDPPFRELIIRAIYLNEESELGLYKDEENNLPYEIWSIGEYLLYRQSIKETKKEIYNRLERLAVEEGLRK